MRTRSLLGSLQLPVAGIGALLLLGSLAELATVSPPAEGDGFPAGLAVLALYVLAWVGFVALALGLSIPAHQGVGIEFTRWQRALFLTAAGGAVASAAFPVVAFGWLFATAMSGNGGLVVLAWAIPAGLAVISLVAGLGWRAAQSIRAHSGR